MSASKILSDGECKFFYSFRLRYGDHTMQLMTGLYPVLDVQEDELNLCLRYPIIYKVDIEQECFEDFLSLYVNGILAESPCSKVESALVSYITRVIEPTGWEAVWRATAQSLKLNVEIECDFIVQVIDVSLTKLEADVLLQSIIVPETSYVNICVIQDKLKINQCITVPLIELYPISEGDQEELFGENAVVIEHIRFFYKHIARPWDGEDEDFCYTEKVIRPRLQLYFDIKHKVLPETMIIKIKSILNEGESIIKDLKALYSDMNASDSESELQEDDVLHSLESRKRLEELQRKMEILENPVIRTLIMKKYIPRKSPQKRPRPQGPITFIVAEHFTYEMVTQLNLPPSTNLHFDQSPELALKFSTDGDTVLIFPGQYRCDTLGWLDGPITVKGVGEMGSIKLQATGSSEVFLNCDSQSIYLENLRMIATPEVVSTIVIHHGKVHMKDCVIDTDGAETGLTLLGGAELTMENGEVCNAKEDGIQLRSASSLTLKSSKVYSCGRHGIQIDADEELYESGQHTDLCILDSYITNNQAHGIYINSVHPPSGTLPDDKGEEISILNSFRWLRYTIENTFLNENELSNVGLSQSYKPIKNLIHLSKFSNPEPKVSVDMECSILDDF